MFQGLSCLIWTGDLLMMFEEAALESAFALRVTYLVKLVRGTIGAKVTIRTVKRLLTVFLMQHAERYRIVIVCKGCSCHTRLVVVQDREWGHFSSQGSAKNIQRLSYKHSL